MISFIRNHMTYFVFALVLLLSLFSIGAVLLTRRLSLWPLLAVSLVLNVWSIYTSERGGFVRKKEFRRWKEPPRHFNATQVIMVYIFIVAQLLLGISIATRMFW